jgi:hypothetical protein
VGYDEELQQPLERRDWEQREVYAKFGLAIYFCQVVEVGLINHLALLRRMKSGKPMTTEQVDQLITRLVANPLGKNLKEVRDLFGDRGTWILEDNLRRVLALRNQLVHHWMRERVIRQGTSENRLAMIAELDAAIAELEVADQVLTRRTETLLAEAGVSLGAVRQDYDRLTALAESGEADEEAPPYYAPPPG